MDLRYLFVISVILLNETLFALSQEWTHFGVRPLGMGNAYVAVSDDFNSLFYNPAGLARQQFDGEFLNFSLETSSSTSSFISEITNNSDAFSDVSKTLELLQKQLGKVHHTGLYWTPHFVFKNFGFGIGLSLPFSFVAHNNINIEVEAGPRVIAPLGFAKNFLDDKLSVGAALKLLFRGGINESFTIETISDATSSDAFEELVEGGVGYGGDLGLLFTPVDNMEPTLGLSITDFGGSTYSPIQIGSNNTGAPRLRLPSVNTGVSLKPFRSGNMYLMTAVDAHMINQPMHYGHKLNLGLEWGYGQLIKIQTGLKAGYYTAGFQLDAGLLSIRLATYAVDHAPIVGLHSDLVERRYIAQIKLLI